MLYWAGHPLALIRQHTGRCQTSTCGHHALTTHSSVYWTSFKHDQHSLHEMRKTQTIAQLGESGPNELYDVCAFRACTNCRPQLKLEDHSQEEQEQLRSAVKVSP